jgi:hypothetical protein
LIENKLPVGYFSRTATRLDVGAVSLFHDEERIEIKELVEDKYRTEQKRGDHNQRKSHRSEEGPGSGNVWGNV